MKGHGVHQDYQQCKGLEKGRAPRAEARRATVQSALPPHSRGCCWVPAFHVWRRGKAREHWQSHLRPFEEPPVTRNSLTIGVLKRRLGIPVLAVCLINSISFIAQRHPPPTTVETSSLLAASSLQLPSPKIQHNSGTEFLLLFNYNSLKCYHGATHGVCARMHAWVKEKLAEV